MAGSSPFFSVVVPTYNRHPMLERALLSVRAQTWDDYELIVVDDGSTDGTGEYLAGLDGSVRMVRQENRGPAAARNAGVALARGAYVAFLDSDDELLPTALATYARAIEAAGRPSLVSGRAAEYREATAAPPGVGAGFAWRGFQTYLTAAAQGIYVGSSHLAVRRDVFAACGGFDEEMHVGEDHDLVLRLGDAPGFVEIASPASVARRMHAAAISRDAERRYTGIARLVRRARAGDYGSTAAARAAARSIVSAHARAGAVALARAGHIRPASAIYLASLGINAGQWRWRYLAAFPFLLAWHALSPARQGEPRVLLPAGGRR